MVLENFFDWIFSPLVNLGDVWAIILISLILTFLVVIIYKVATNQDLMKKLKAEIKDLQKNMKAHKDDPTKFMEMQKEAMQKNMTYMKHSMKPTLYTMIPMLLILGWLSKTFGDKGELLSWGFKLPLFGTGFGWLGTYIVFSILFSLIIRKILKVH